MAEPTWTIFLAGNCWDDVAGTDHHLAEALAADGPVLWVDPARSVLRARPGSGRLSVRPLPPERIATGLHVLRPVAPPAPSRPVARDLARVLLRRQVATAARRLDAPVATIVVASPQAEFVGPSGARKVLTVTDDWVVGAPLMGLDAAAVRRRLVRNVVAADVVTAVSPTLAREIERLSGGASRVEVLPNGVDLVPIPAGVERTSTAALVGQLNDRLDVALLEGCVAAGIRLLVVGPLAARDPAVAAGLRRVLDHPAVTWRGRVPTEQVATELAAASVGLTPYLDTPFNRASFPLKTLEYLAAGLPVVSTDLPTARWLDSPEVDLATGPQAFVAAVRRRLESVPGPAELQRRRDVAAEHTWAARAAQLRTLVEVTEMPISPVGDANSRT